MLCIFTIDWIDEECSFYTSLQKTGQKRCSASSPQIGYKNVVNRYNRLDRKMATFNILFLLLPAYPLPERSLHQICCPQLVLLNAHLSPSHQRPSDYYLSEFHSYKFSFLILLSSCLIVSFLAFSYQCTLCLISKHNQTISIQTLLRCLQI